MCWRGLLGVIRVVLVMMEIMAMKAVLMSGLRCWSRMTRWDRKCLEVLLPSV